jgi:hypothetical protein
MLTVMEPGGLTQAMVLFATAGPMLPVTVAASTVKVAVVSVLGLGNGFAAMLSLL